MNFDELLQCVKDEPEEISKEDWDELNLIIDTGGFEEMFEFTSRVISKIKKNILERIIANS